MKFATSRFAIRYDAVWNDNVVPADIEIKAIINTMLSHKKILKTDKQALVGNIERYAMAVKSIVNNLVRQLTYFEDKENAYRYLLSTLESVHTDFDEYRNMLGAKADSDVLNLIDKVKQELNASVNGMFSKSGGASCAFYPYEERYNLMWNNEVVLADSKIRKMLNNRGIFKFDAKSCAGEIRHYIQVVNRIVDDLVEHFGDFDEKLNASQYLMSTINSVNADLGAYRSALVRLAGRDFSCIKLIDDTTRELELSARYLFAVPKSSSADLSDDDGVSVLVSNESLESLESLVESDASDYSPARYSDNSQDFSETELETASVLDDSFWGEWPQELEDRACSSSSTFY